MLSRLVAAFPCLLACGNTLVAESDARPDASADAAQLPDSDSDEGYDVPQSPDAALQAEDAASAQGDAGAATDAASAEDAGQLGRAALFDGVDGYVEIPDDDVFSEATHGGLTIEAWIRPDSLDMPNREGTGYVHWLGKGEPGQHEWVARMYQEGNEEGRENRISFYAFNLSGGLGAGSYVQESVTPGEWIHYVGQFDDLSTFIYKNGEPKDTDALSDYSITPENGTAPVRIGTRDLRSFFEGAITRVALYAGKLDAARIRAHAQALGTDSYDALVLDEPSLVAFYKLDESAGTVAHDAKGGRHGVYHGGVTLGGAMLSR